MPIFTLSFSPKNISHSFKLHQYTKIYSASNNFTLTLKLVLSTCTKHGISIVEQTHICNGSWTFTDRLTSVKVAAKQADNNDQCNCVVYHPENQVYLENLLLLFQTYNASREPQWSEWINVSQPEWTRGNISVPTFYTNNTGGNNQFCTQKDGNSICTIAAVTMTFLNKEGLLIM